MNELSRQALDISNEFPFSAYLSSAMAEDKSAGVEFVELTAHANHLDHSFMDLLKSGAHLNPEIVPF